MESGESVTEHIILSQTKDGNPKLWDLKKYPVENPNLSDYDLELKVSVLSLVLKGEIVEMPKSKIE
ncbi:hypothetical protein [Solitalea lacus]|uniref:hypothetical protein n=1 Tax=Solitalea lacus TaxID=2911172 RepID=UPI001ED9D8F1|nr:hypothetical protein [Solitalea lacus]UKJ08529.1 hypothetical protein L2B55_05040 [Solitalea lacus]